MRPVKRKPLQNICLLICYSDSTFASDSYVAARVDDCRFEEPGYSQAHQDVEDVTADGVGHRHVTMT